MFMLELDEPCFECTAKVKIYCVDTPIEDQQDTALELLCEQRYCHRGCWCGFFWGEK
jgi:hypothetical protein